jgi:transketolase
MDQNNNIFRKEVINNIFSDFQKDQKYYLLVGDMGFGAIDKLKKEFPERVINCGIMEQGMVGIAAGMAMSGLKPVVYTIVNFLAFRSIEQIRNDVVLHNLNVKFIGTGANDYFKFLGRSHCCGENDIALMELIGLKVYNPYASKMPFSELVQKWINDKEAGYLRV